MDIKVDKVSKSMGEVHILDHIDIAVHKHEFVVILGPSGCGKSTLFNIIAGLLLPDEGRILLDGKDYTGQTGRIGYMQQKDLLLPSRTILDNVCIPLVLKGMPQHKARQKAFSYLPDFGLEGFAAYYPRQLSGGMRQRAALLRTYLFASDILLLDEPFVALDAISRRKMQLWLRELRSHYPCTILFVTHDIDEALMLADRIYLFSARPAKVRLEIKTASAPHDVHKETILHLLEEET
ncbi:MAG TPA: ABC transporter ATP-binding protein [Syntrophomonadaceae bacterium]|nr:ABC transporter ATP-binding protein [Syntrophomonadaceae bacterium]